MLLTLLCPLLLHLGKLDYLQFYSALSHLESWHLLHFSFWHTFSLSFGYELKNPSTKKPTRMTQNWDVPSVCSNGALFVCVFFFSTYDSEWKLPTYQSFQFDAEKSSLSCNSSACHITLVHSVE